MPHLPPGAVQKGLSSRWDKYLGMTAAMTQVPPTATAATEVTRLSFLFVRFVK